MESLMRIDMVCPRIAVVGAGAIGCYFGGALASVGAQVTLIGRQPVVDAVNQRGLLLETERYQGRIAVEATSDIAAVKGAEIVLFCVKATDTTVAATELAPFVESKTLVISLQNGVDNAEKIRNVLSATVFSAAVYVAVFSPQLGQIKDTGRGAHELVLGSDVPRLFTEILHDAGISVRLSDNIIGELWIKLLWNCALNAISALGRARYGEIAESSCGRILVEKAVLEVLAVANAAGIVLSGYQQPHGAIAGAFDLAKKMSGAMSSTAQDLERGHRTEIDSFNGYICRKAATFGIETPYNQALYALVKLAETERLTISASKDH
jgi:2-dehydropantoate 2-reductase